MIHAVWLKDGKRRDGRIIPQDRGRIASILKNPGFLGVSAPFAVVSGYANTEESSTRLPARS
jgi:hypothetical protein